MTIPNCPSGLIIRRQDFLRDGFNSKKSKVKVGIDSSFIAEFLTDIVQNGFRNPKRVWLRHFDWSVFGFCHYVQGNFLMDFVIVNSLKFTFFSQLPDVPTSFGQKFRKILKFHERPERRENTSNFVYIIAKQHRSPFNLTKFLTI